MSEQAKNVDEAFEEFWSEAKSEGDFDGVSKNLAKQIYSSGFRAGGHRPWYSLSRPQIEVIYKMMRRPGWIEKKESGTPGIRWDKDRQKWRVMYRHKYVGIFSDLDEAKAALAKVKS